MFIEDGSVRYIFNVSCTIFEFAHFCQDRDQVEDAELARKEAAEGLPNNVQDFRNHPYYVLERHLRRNEVIHPRNEVGKVSVGGHASTNLESIYRRRDVNIVRSADKWYRLGREVKVWILVAEICI